MSTAHALALCLILAVLPAYGATIIENFEEGPPPLESYPGQDQDPGGWEILHSDPWEGEAALRLFGNTWKMQPIAPRPLKTGSIWQVAVKVQDQGPPHSSGEMIGFGVGDGVNELIYTFAGSQLPQGSAWWTVYQGAFPPFDWFPFLLPVGEDWMATYGYLPEITTLFYVNDKDGGGPAAVVFDAIADVTEDLPVPPQVTASYTVEKLRRIDAARYRASVQFYAQVFDPDSPSHEFFWDFGDGSTSTEQDPAHDFIVQADYEFTVAVLVTDPDGYTGGDTCQVNVEEGLGDGPFTINFVGDIMIGRNYESPGGIIDTYGVDAIFAPSYPIFGGAADVSYANLEVPFTDQGTPHPTKSVVFRARPENIVGVANAGIDLVSLGNNHIIDYGEPGMLQTMELLDGLGIAHSGAGVSDYFALRPAFWTERGVRMAFLGSSNRTGRQWNYQPFLDAGVSKGGFAYLIPKNLEESIALALPLADLVILQTHSGDEYEAEPPPDGFRSGRDLPAVIEADMPLPGDPDFSFRIEPSPGERELRRMGLDLGAHVVINHHPHVLQGFEVYKGKLIAHSLGNFIFDLYYPETMPTIVLTLEVDKDGIQGYTFRPAWIDDYITQPATGRLGREIMDRMADYSRPMGALVASFPEENYARVFVDPSQVEGYVEASEGDLAFVEENGFKISAPLELSGHGSVSRILSLTGEELGDWEIRFGRELVWHGGFEEEGATFWDINSADEWIDEGQAYQGSRSLTLRRSWNNTQAVGTDLEKYLPCDPAKEHSFLAVMRGENAGESSVMLRFYRARYDYYGNFISSTDIGPPMTGDFEWTPAWRNLETPANAKYFDIRASMTPPESGEGRSWFDEMKLVEWDDWQVGIAGLEVPHPGNFRFLQVRTALPGPDEVEIAYEETHYDGAPTDIGETPRASGELLLAPFPNPFNPRTTLTMVAPLGEGPVAACLEIFDVHGRRVATLFRGELNRGERRVFTWQGRDDRGRTMSSGLYFARARVGTESASRKLLLVK